MNRSGTGSLAVGACGVALFLLSVGPTSSVPDATSPASTPLWVARYNGRSNLDDSATALAIGPRGHRLFVTGYSQAGAGSSEAFAPDFVTAAYAASTGTLLWRTRYAGPGESADAPVAIAVGPGGGRVYVTGRSFNGVNGDYATVAYDGSSGKRVWAATHDAPVGGEDVPASLAVSPDGSTIYVTGSSETESVTEYVTVAYNSTDGAERWVVHFAGPGDGPNEASSVTANADGSAVFVTGSASVGASLDFSTVAYEASNGRELWVATYGRAAKFDGARFALASPDGSTVFVTGQSTGRTRADDYATLAYSASTGDQLWVARYNGPGDSVDAARHLAIDPDGSTLYVTGESVGKSEGFDYATVAYDSATGTRLWTARYDGPTSADDLATSIAVNPDGATVYVTGSAVYGTRISATIDHGTVAYDAATGARLWLAHYDGPVHEHDVAAALAVDPDGSTVYVTGESEGVSSHRLDLLPLDYATLAYRA